MADGKPDLSGLWSVVRSDARPGRPLYDISTIAEGGALPLRPEAAALAAQRAPFDSKLRVTEPKPNCLPQGPFLDDYDGWNQLVQTPSLLINLTAWNKKYRLIHLDGRPLPVDPEPTWDGYSTAHWDGDVLVVETIGFNGRNWLDIHGNPISDAAKLTERYHREDFGHMTLLITVDDPTNYTKPWTVTFKKMFRADTETLDEFCLENEKDLSRIQKANEAGKNK
jgi:hypothetical protein